MASLGVLPMCFRGCHTDCRMRMYENANAERHTCCADKGKECHEGCCCVSGLHHACLELTSSLRSTENEHLSGEPTGSARVGQESMRTHSP